MSAESGRSRLRCGAVLVSSLLSAAALAFTGHAQAAIPGAMPAAAGLPVDFEVFLPLRNSSQLDALLAAQQTKGSPSYHQWLTPAQFKAQFGPTAATVAAAKAALEAAGFKVTAEHSRSLHVLGTAGAVNAAFGVSLQAVTDRAGHAQLMSEKNLVMPAALKAQGAVVVAFSSRPAHHTDARRVALPAGADNRTSETGFYWFDDLKEAYDYPSYASTVRGKTLDGTGVNVAILMSSDVLDSDIAAVFDHEKFSAITGKPDPTVSRFYIDGGAPFSATSDASFEASLDVQQVLGGAPGANVTVIDVPDLSDANVIAGYVDIDEVNAWDIVSSSFGECELFYSPAYNGGQDFSGILAVFDDLFRQGNSQGITFLASSGDSGGLGCPDPSYFSGPSATAVFQIGVESPAADPHVTAVGGANLITTPPPKPQTTPPTLTSDYVRELAYGNAEAPYDPYGVGVNVSGGYWAAGGGVSRYFLAPLEQALVPTGRKMRTVPDVGMQVGGCPLGLAVLPCTSADSAVIVSLGGTLYGAIGTSVASPEFAGALALAEQDVGGRVGDINPYLYLSAAAQAASGGSFAPFHQDIPGFDGKYSGGKTYNFMVGNGSPDVRVLFGLQKFAPAGDPQTPSNP